MLTLSTVVKESRLSAELAHTQLEYDPETGTLTKRRAFGGQYTTGTPNGKGYLVIRLVDKVETTKYLVHRVAWLLTYGTWPSGELDHIDNDRMNNRISNLRETTGSQNQYNRGAAKHSLTGIKGVTFDQSRGRYMARITIKGKFVNLGRFATEAEAAAAYEAKAKAVHGEFFNNGL